ncbi:phospholipase D zeta 1-like isoform X2 [Magnolia sinica]|uniref:phospholipase D zeta 1-like isoform X2 n=1 Tax=Magnolia sinica TaxID=86752 RepID=UPI0026582BD7|nr:phospholipase D zeta 1-like isoform X2 [Magnolia sinica]
MSTDASEQIVSDAGNYRYVKMHSEPLPMESSSHSFRLGSEPAWVFDELPKATIVSVSRPDVSDISPLLLSYTIQFKYKQFRWRLVKKAPQVFFLHFALKKRAIIEEIHEKQEQVKEWLQNLGIGEHTTAVQDDDEADYDNVPSHHEESYSSRNRNVPSRAALPIIRPAIGRQQSISDRAKVAMQEYLNHFLGNLDIANSREVCKFLEVSKLSFLPEYGPKLKEDFVMVKHLPKIVKDEDKKCCTCHWFSCCNGNWQKVWAVLKPGFLALLEDPFNTRLLDIIVFDVLPSSDGNGEGRLSLAREIKEHNPLRYGFRVSCGTRSIKLRAKSSGKVKDWIAAINDAGLRPPEGWCHPHRFGSFAPPRGLTEDGSQAQWFVDGKAAFEAIASSIEEAKSENCIFVALFTIMGNTDLILYWKQKLSKACRSHHEKIVIVDYQVCYIGGLDLCFGRYDTFEHKVGDYPPQIWPGKDYYNPRESEPNSWEDTMKDELDRKKYPRMPWHDVHCALWGPPCRDVARHFVQRWNFAKRNKALNEQAIPLLMPQHHMVIPHYMGKSKEIDVQNNKQDENHEGIKRQFSLPSRSSYQDVPLLLPQGADGVDISNVNEKPNGLDMIHNCVDHPNRINRSLPFSFRKSKVEPSIADMQMKGFVDDLDVIYHQREVSMNTVAHLGMKHLDQEWWETQERGDQVVSADEAGQVGPCTSCRCQVIRSVGQWSAGTSQTEDSIHNAYCSLIEKAEYFIYIENQFFISGISGDDIIRNRVLEALYSRILRADREKKCFRVIIVLPLLPGFQGGLDDSGAASVRAIMHWQYRTICRGPNSILKNLYDLLGPKTDDYISFYGLRTFGRLHDDGPLATSQVYVHSKLMIIDDRIVLLGSANINDRSLLGSRDSEIGVVIEDKDFIDSFMNGRSWKAGKFAFSLRQSLWSEHLGLHVGEMSRISDPVNDATYKDIWMATAKTNSMIYQDVFACIPNDLNHSRSAIRQNMSYWKEKLGHTTIDLGIAPNKLETYQNGDIKSIDPMERLESVKGYLVSFPLDFMCQEDLRPVFNESEFYASPQVFH